jgi:hypothetical protein
LKEFDIIINNLNYFIFDNISNNDIIFEKLIKKMGFDLQKQRLCYISHIINLITEVYLYKQNSNTFEIKFKKVRIIYRYGF